MNEQDREFFVDRPLPDQLPPVSVIRDRLWRLARERHYLQGLLKLARQHEALSGASNAAKGGKAVTL